MFELPETIITDVLSYATGIIGDFFPVLALFIGIALAFFILERVLQAKNN